MATMPFPAEGTLLVLYGNGGIPLYSARDLDQTLAPIKASQSQRRTVNGTLVDISLAQFHKYESKIRCKDVEAPSLDGVFPGMALTVDCVAELAFRTGGSPSRAVVPGSARANGAFTVYRPRLNMIVTNLSQRLGEYDHDGHWELELEEV